ncbi:MAG: hypothetical protein OXC13_07695 [Caldilineaceae bacterium]|nr:hypothetical protein [Caldilineaceae bacterium]
MQQGLTSFHLRIDWDTDRQQSFDNADLSFPHCRVQQGLAVGTGSEQKLSDTGMSRPGGRVQRSPATVGRQVSPGTHGKQNLRGADVACPSSCIQRGLPIIPLSVDWDTNRKQNLDDADLSFLRCRVQQGLAIGTDSEQKLYDFGMARPSGRVKRSPAAVRR